MRIAQVAPLYESVPPQLYGGTERVVSYLTEELVSLGHDVTLFASGDSKTAAHLIPIIEKGLRLSKGVVDTMALHYLMLEEVSKISDRFDIIHFHIDYLHFLLSRRANYRHVTTLHGRLDIPEVIRLHHEFEEMPLISISDAQRMPLKDAQWVATVYHGLPINLYRHNDQPDSYLAFLGRISPEKRLDLAIQVAELSGMPLKVAAKIDNVDKEYFDMTIKPLLRYTSSVEFLGEINDCEKQEFLGNAAALLFTVDWPEPFGLVMIEAMACGTPVIAFGKGSVPEILEDKRTGFVVKNVIDAANAVAELNLISRRACRDEFEKRFSSRRMAQNYVEAYQLVNQLPSGGYTKSAAI